MKIKELITYLSSLNQDSDIKISTFCSGSAENTSLVFQTKSLLEGFDD